MMVNQKLIVPHLMFVINACIVDYYFPTEMKKAKATPLFKTKTMGILKNIDQFQ